MLEVIVVRLDRETSTGDEGENLAPLPVLRLQPEASAVVGLGGDVEAAAVRFDPPLVILLELPADQNGVQFAITYRLPRDIPAVEIGAVLRTQQLGVSIARGNIDARPDRSLIRAGSAGSPSRPRNRYRAGPIPADSTVRVHLYDHRVSWRERLIVFFIAAAAAVTVLVWVWGRRPSSDAG